MGTATERMKKEIDDIRREMEEMKREIREIRAELDYLKREMENQIEYEPDIRQDEQTGIIH